MQLPLRPSRRPFSWITTLLSLLLALLVLAIVLATYLDRPDMSAALLALVLSVGFGATQFSR
jgi:hypothetical protein